MEEISQDARLLRYTFRIGFSFALETLIRESAKDIGWSAEEKNFPKDLREFKRIPGRMRIIQDRFAFFFQSCRIPPEWSDEFRKLIFSTWLNWGHRTDDDGEEHPL